MNKPPHAASLLPTSPLKSAQRKADFSDQPPLPGFENVPAPAERVFVKLARQWNAGFSAAVTGPPRRVVDELALTAVLFAQQYGKSFTNFAWRQTEINIALAEQRDVPWADRLPWRLAAASWKPNPGQTAALHELVSNLNHHNSALRIWTMELAWMVRPWLTPDSALTPLLENVAGTLLGVDLAFGLAGTLFSVEKDLYAAAEAWQPPAIFAEQYKDRVAALRRVGLLATQASFWQLEASCRRAIAEPALSKDDVAS